jgi:peptidylprolyl isomerase
MKHIFLTLLMAASAAAASSLTPANPATNAASAAKTAALKSEDCSIAAAGITLPADIAPVKGDVKSVFALRYQDYVIGTGAEAEPNKLYKVQYTYWLAADGHKIDSTYDHGGPPIKDKDGKVVLGPDGKIIPGPPNTVNFTQGRHQMIFGFDQGLVGMRVGGKRRLYVPYQLAYGPMGHLPAIPPMADMIYDVELVDVVEPDAPPLPPAGRGGINDLRGHRAGPIGTRSTTAPAAAPSSSTTPAPPAAPTTTTTPPPPAAK